MTEIKKTQVDKCLAAREPEPDEFEEALHAMVKTIATQRQSASADAQIVEGSQDAIRSSKKILNDHNSN